MIIKDGKIVGATVLIIDDDKDTREALAASIMLVGINLGIVTAHNAVTGVQLAIQVTPDVILLDYNMPMGDGFATAKGLRAVESLRQTKILMLTAHDTADVRWNSVDNEIDAFMGKPFDITDVEAHIFSLLTQIQEAKKF